MNNNYTYDENQSTGHGFSFSLRPGIDQISPRLQNFQPISERSHESSINYKSSMSSSIQKARAFNLAPELTLDDLREKLRNDDFQVKRNNNLEDLSSLKSSLQRIERPIESKDLLSSMSSHYLERSEGSRFKGNNTERQYNIKDTPISTLGEDNDSSRPFYKSPPGESFPWETKPSSSPLHARSLSSQLKSPTKAPYNWNRDSSANRYNNPISSLPPTESYTRFERRENFNPSSSGRDDIKNQLSRTRSPTPTKGVSPLLNPKGNTGSYLGSSYLGSSTYSSKDVQQDLKEKLEQFDKKLAEIQGEFIHSKTSSQDPYKISLNSMKMLPKDDLVDALSSKPEEKSRRPIHRGINDENQKDLGNQDDKDKPLQIDNLISSQTQNSKPGTHASTGSLRKDYTQGFKEIKQRYSDMFLPKDMKTLTNPYKILKQRYEEKFDRSVKTYLQETAVLTHELNQNLLNVKPN